MREYALYVHQRYHDNLVRQHSLFDTHGVPEEDRVFLHRGLQPTHRRRHRGAVDRGVRR